MAVFSAALVGALGVMLAFTLAASPEANQPSYWGDDCIKIDEGTGDDSYTADQDYRLVVLKSGTVNDEFYNVKAGQTVSTVSGKDISHIILCDEEEPPSTTSTAPTSTSSVPSTSTTVTSTTAPPTTVPPTTVPPTTAPPTTAPPEPPPVVPSNPAVPVPAEPQFTG